MSAAAIVSRELQTVAQAIDKQLAEIAGERCGFFLFVWAGGEVNYVGSDSDRVRVATAMREILAKWEAGVNDTPAHRRH